MRKITKHTSIFALLLVACLLLTACGEDGQSQSGTQGSTPPGEVDVTTPSVDMSDLVEAVGLVYKVNEDGKTCTISDRGTCYDQKIYIPETIDGYTVTAIGTGAFHHDFSHWSVDMYEVIVLPDTVVSIGEEAFHGCKALRSINIPDTVTQIGARAFSKTGLTEVNLPTQLQELGDGAFAACENLVSVVIPDSIQGELEGTFDGCVSLSNVKIGGGVQSLVSTFANCESLTNITLGEGIQSITTAFSGCTALSTVNLNNGLKTIGVSSFAGCHSLVSISIPNTVTTIEEGAFAGCLALEEVTVGKDVKMIDYRSFSQCSALIKITYSGTAEEWGKIEKRENWDSNTPNYTVHCTDGDIVKE